MIIMLTFLTFILFFSRQYSAATREGLHLYKGHGLRPRHQDQHASEVREQARGYHDPVEPGEGRVRPIRLPGRGLGSGVCPRTHGQWVTSLDEALSRAQVAHCCGNFSLYLSFVIRKPVYAIRGHQNDRSNYS